MSSNIKRLESKRGDKIVIIDATCITSTRQCRNQPEKDLDAYKKLSGFSSP